jgi:hypothetical protein
MDAEYDNDFELDLRAAAQKIVWQLRYRDITYEQVIIAYEKSLYLSASPEQLVQHPLLQTPSELW